MQSQGVADWQLEQAEHAIRTYFHTYLDGAQREITPARAVSAGTDGAVVSADVLAAMRDRLRLMHYAYRTEQTYIDWTSRFFEYLSATGGMLPGGRCVITQQAVKNYVTYLGHASVETTMIYTHAVKDMRNPATSPLDMLRTRQPQLA